MALELKNILLVDDDPAIHTLVRSFLDPKAYKLISALDPTQAFSVVRKEKIDLIILDVKMPAGGGVELYKRFSALPAISGIPIVILSSVSKDEIDGLFGKDNGLALLSKPVTKENFLYAVENKLNF